MSITSSFEVVTERECRELLASQDVGRVAFVGEDGFPVVLPVNYLVDEDLIVFRTAPGAKTTFIPMRPVAFEVDGFERWNRGGWSVLVQGLGHSLSDSNDPRHGELRGRTITTWAPGEHLSWLAIDVRRISGRRICSIPEPTSSRYGVDDG
jgi:nitroimidazol reductase NimA-like FMN-containing flavoprotein (pyridoxamine 5'-phosphate oxidase superfamily)